MPSLHNPVSKPFDPPSGTFPTPTAPRPVYPPPVPAGGILAAILLVLILAGTLYALAWPTAVIPARSPVPVTCEEDQPCWDCATMGNMICGPTDG